MRTDRMVAEAAKSNTHYARFVALVRSLHQLIANGQCDSPAADELREEMDFHARHLTQAETSRVEGLSADLYSITGEELCAPKDKPNPVSEDDLRAAWEGKRYDRVLEMLRRPAFFLNPSQLAFMRGWCWHELGDRETALLFLRRSFDLDPSVEQTAVLLIYTLLELDRPDEARRLAEGLIERESVGPLTLDAAAFALAVSIDRLEPLEQRRILSRMIESIQRATASMGADTSNAAGELFRHHLLLSLGYAYLSELQASDAEPRKEPSTAVANTAAGPLEVPGVRFEMVVPALGRYSSRRFVFNPLDPATSPPGTAGAE